MANVAKAHREYLWAFAVDAVMRRLFYCHILKRRRPLRSQGMAGAFR